MLNRFSNLTPVVKYLLIINGSLLALTFILNQFVGIDLVEWLGLFFFKSKYFQPYQIVTHMFMHGNFVHLLFNMYALFLFGTILERNNVWGSKRFLIYYLVTGFGASILHFLIIYIKANMLIKGMDPDIVKLVMEEGREVLLNNKNYADPQMGKLNALINVPTVGASGAVFGLLLAFGMLFPNIPLQILFVPIPIKAKYFVIGYGAIELISGIINRQGDNVAHFAHLGGMLFGIIFILIWGKGKNFKKWN